MKVTTMPEKFTAMDLARAVRKEDLFRKSFLFPHGNLTTNTLPESLNSLGAAVHPVMVYQTERPSDENLDPIKAMLLNGKVDVMTFLSPSAFKNFTSLFPLETVRQIQQHTKTAVIGPMTAKAIEEQGFAVDLVAKRATVESLSEALVEFFSPQS